MTPESNLDAVGAGIARMRDAIGWTQEELGRRSGTSQSWVSKVEHGRCPDLSIGAADRLLAAMGARLVVTIDAPYLADRRRQADPAHAKMSASCASRLRRDGWLVETEVEVGGDRSRGWIDLLAFDPRTGILLVIELKTEIHDVGQIQRSLAWYVREAWAAARRRGWKVRRVIGGLVLLATRANDTRSMANRDLLGAEFPLRARELQALVTGRVPPESGGRFLVMVDPRSRRAAWLRPLWLDGRRTQAPYADYADFMRAVHRAGRGTRRTPPAEPTEG